MIGDSISVTFARMAASRSNKRPSSPAKTADVSAGPWPLPDDWLWSTVSMVGTVRLGRQRSPEMVSSKFPTKYLRAANIKSGGIDLTEVLEMDFDEVERQVYALVPGDVVLTEASGSADQVGRAGLWTGAIPDCCFQNTVIRFRPHAVLPEYALVVFRHFAAAGMFAAAARGVGIQHLGASAFKVMPFPLPPRAEQERIAAEVSTRLRQVDEARTSILAAIEKTLRQDDVILEAAALGGLIGPTAPASPVAGTQSFLSDGETLFLNTGGEPKPHPEFADLLSHTLPPGWRWTRVDRAGELRLGRQRSPEHEYGDHVKPYLRVANVFEDRIDTADVRSMNFTPAEQEIYRLIPGDVLLNEGQSPELVGRSAIYRGEPVDVCFQNTLIRFRGSRDVDAEFALLVFRHYLRAGYFTRIARWSTNIAHLGVARLASLPFPLPPLAEQSEIVREARDRLEASAAQRRAMQRSVDGTSAMRREVLRASVCGALVQQDPGDGTAGELLSRLGPPVETVPSTEGKERRVAKRSKVREEARRPLIDTLRQLEGSAPTDRVYIAARYDPDSIADVESFYLTLREEKPGRIVAKTTELSSRLEAAPDAP